MNEVYTVDELARDCSDFAEHVDKIVEQIRLGDIVEHSFNVAVGTAHTMTHQVDLNSVFDELGEDNAREMLSKLDGQNPVPAKFLVMLDEKLQELAEEAARSYKGKYCE